LERELNDTAIRGRQEEAVANMRLALDAYDHGHAARALRAALAAKEAAPRAPSVREALGLIYQSLGSPKEALSELQAARRMSGSPYQIAAIAECLIATGRPERALEELAGLTKEGLPPEVWADAQIARAAAHERLGNVDAAIGVLRNADGWPSNPKPYDAHVRYALADTLARAGQREEARKLFVRLALWNRDFRDVVARAR
jgi:tetratricopeptide (TPR) repeat protein